MTGHEATRDADLEARLSHARALLAPRPGPGLDDAVRASRWLLDPSLAVEAERERAYRENYGRRKARDGRHSGFKRGAPQCPSCREFLTGHGAWCAKCRTFNGNHDHGR